MTTVNNPTNSGKNVMFSYQWDIQGGMKTNSYEG